MPPDAPVTSAVGLSFPLVVMWTSCSRPSMRGHRGRRTGGRRSRPYRQQKNHSGQHVQRHHEIHAVNVVVRGSQNKSIDRRTERWTKVSETADEGEPTGGGTRRQILAGQCEEERGRRRNPDDREGESEDRSDQIALEQRCYEKANRRNSNASGKVPSALMPLVRMATDQDHTDDAGSIGDCCIDSNE